MNVLFEDLVHKSVTIRQKVITALVTVDTR